MKENDDTEKLKSRGEAIIKRYKQTDYQDVSDDARDDFVRIFNQLLKSDKENSTQHAMSLWTYADSLGDHTIFEVMTKIHERRGFSLDKHIEALIDKLDFSEQQKQELSGRCKINNDVYYMYQKRRLYKTGVNLSHDASEYIEGKQKISHLIDDFKDNDSLVAEQLRIMLEKYPIDVEIAKGDDINGSMETTKDRLKLTINEGAIKNTELLPGLLAHEIAHALDYTQRPEKYLGHFAGEETFADLCGQLMAEKAGYDSRPWARYIKENDTREYYVKDIRPSGSFRYDTIIKSESEEKRRGSNFAEKISNDVALYSKIRNFVLKDPQYQDVDPEKARLKRVFAAARTVFDDISDNLHISKDELKGIPPNKYCLMGIIKNLRSFQRQVPMAIIPNDAIAKQSPQLFIAHILNDNNLQKYVQVTQDINSEINAKPGCLFIMTNLDKKDNYSSANAEDLNGSNHANVVIGRSAENGNVLLSAFSEERVGYQPKTFKKGYLVDIPRYLCDYTRSSLNQRNPAREI